MTVLDLVAPAFFNCPDYDEAHTRGPEVAAVSTLAGFAPDPEQQILLDPAFAFDRKGKPLAFEVVVIAPRQNLKTGFLKQYALGQLFVCDQRLVVFSAHEFGTASETMRDMEQMIDGSDLLRKRIKRTYRGDIGTHGAVPTIELLSPPGCDYNPRLIFKTRTSGGGRGLTGDKTILDEGYALQAGHTGAIYPIMLARPEPQVVIASSACRPESAVLWEIVQRGRPGGDPRQLYAEWCAPAPEEVCEIGAECDHMRGTPGCGCDNMDIIRSIHSAIARERIDIQSVMDMRKLPVGEYVREIMGWHDETAGGGGPIPAEDWAARYLEGAGVTGSPVFALDVSPRMTYASLAAAGGGPAGLHGELLHRAGQSQPDSRPGTEWILPALADLASRVPNLTVALAANGQAKSLKPDIEALGIEVLEVPTTEMGPACGLAFKLATGGGMTHSGQPELAGSVAAVKWRDTGEGAQVWGRRRSGEITGWYAVTIALWVANQAANYDIKDSIL